MQITNQMKIKYFALLFTILLEQQTWAQLNPPTIKANSSKITIKDGLEERRTMKSENEGEEESEG